MRKPKVESTSDNAKGKSPDEQPDKRGVEKQADRPDHVPTTAKRRKGAHPQMPRGKSDAPA